MFTFNINFKRTEVPLQKFFTMKSLLKIAVLALTLICSVNSFAWGTTGHRVVAEIANRNLSNKAKKEIKKIIGNQKLAYWANWPDFIKSDKSFSFADSWHYLNIPGNLTYNDYLTALNNSSDNNMYKRIEILVNELKDENLPLAKKQQNLYFLMHIVGDAHQPMHVGRAEDLGGNKITVEWFGTKTNIHTVWDSKLVDFEKYSYTEYSEVLNILDKKEIKKIQEGTLADWIFDSYNLANNIYGEVNENHNLKYEYQYLNKQNVENQLLKGGLRLAKILNELYK